MRTVGRLAVLALLLTLHTVAAKDEPVQYDMVGDETVVHGTQILKVEGVGLVVGLSGTGSEPPPNAFRERMLDTMQRKNVENPEEILASNSTAIVILRAFIPPGTRKGDMIDVEVYVPPGDDVAELKGGYLLEAMLTEQVATRGSKLLKGDEWLRVEGPLLVQSDPNDPENPAARRKGKILGQGKVLQDRDYRLLLSDRVRGGRYSKMLAQRINARFYVGSSGAHRGVANPVDDRIIDLRIPPNYRFNTRRFLLVVRRIPRESSESIRSQWLAAVGAELLDPGRAIESALRLEALGPAAIPFLKEGLRSHSTVVQFASAEALAYLGDAAGISVLEELARVDPLYRSYALAAMVALDHPASRVKMMNLLKADGTEIRYGAFRSLWVFDKDDPLIRGEAIGDELSLHLIECDKDPMIHVASAFRREIVLFQPNQRLIAPLFLECGSDILLTAEAGNETGILAVFQRGKGSVNTRHVQVNLTVAEVIREAVRHGARYPDIAQMLQRADEQGALEGRLAINALPQAEPLEELARDDRRAMSIADSGDPDFQGLFSTVDGHGQSRPRKMLVEPEDEIRITSDKDRAREKSAGRSWWNPFRRSAN